MVHLFAGLIYPRCLASWPRALPLCGSVALASVLKGSQCLEQEFAHESHFRNIEACRTNWCVTVEHFSVYASRLKAMRSCSWITVRKLSGFWAGEGRDDERYPKQAKCQASHLLELAVREQKPKASLHFVMPHSRDVGLACHCLLEVGDVEPSTNVFCGSRGH